MRRQDLTERTEAGSASVSILMVDYDYPMVVPTNDDVSINDLGDLVADRIEANGGVTLPDRDEWPENGATMSIGVVYWDENGIPTTLIQSDREQIVVFDESGGIDLVIRGE